MCLPRSDDAVSLFNLLCTMRIHNGPFTKYQHVMFHFLLFVSLLLDDDLLQIMAVDHTIPPNKKKIEEENYGIFYLVYFVLLRFENNSEK